MFDVAAFSLRCELLLVASLVTIQQQSPAQQPALACSQDIFIDLVF